MRQTIKFSDVWPNALDVKEAKGKRLPIFLGSDLVVDLVRMPNLLVGGADGWGKTNFLNCMICGLARLLPPDRLQFVLMDTKLVEFIAYGKFPHLAIPVSYKESECIAAFKWLVDEMERRLKTLRDDFCRCIEDYQKYQKAGKEMPYIVVVVDEFADLIAKHGKEIEPLIEQLDNFGHATGIHLVMATGVLDREVLTLSIRRSLKGRIAFKTLGEEQSRLLIDVDNAMSLCERGDMLVRMPDDTFVNGMCGFLSAQEQNNILEELQILSDGVEMAKRLQEVEEHLYACRYLPDLAAFLRKMEAANLLPDKYYLSGLLEWTEGHCNAWTYEEYEKYPKSAARQTVWSVTDWSAYLLRVWGNEKRGGVLSFIRIVGWVLDQYEYLGKRINAEIKQISERYGSVGSGSDAKGRLEAEATFLGGLLPLAEALRALREMSIEDCGEYLACHQGLNITDMPRIRHIQRVIDKDKLSQKP